MEDMAARLMGEPILSGAVVLTKGQTSRLAIPGGGIVGGLVAGTVAAMTKPPTTPGNHRGHVYVAVGPSKVAFFSVKQGLFRQSIQGKLAEHRRDEVLALEITGGLLASVVFVLRDGTDYSLECGRLLLGRVKKVKEELGA